MPGSGRPSSPSRSGHPGRRAPEGRATRRPTRRSPLRVDLDGIVRRVAAFPVPEGRFGQIAGVAGGKVVWTLLPIAGAHGRGGHKDAAGPARAVRFPHDERDDAGRARPTRSSSPATRPTLVVREGKRLRAIRADRRPRPRATRDAGRDEPSRKSGWIDLARVRLSVDPRREWAQMLHEVWRLQRDQFWVPDMSGVDWEGDLPPLRAAARARVDAQRAVRPDLGDPGRARHVARLRDGRRPPPAAAGRARPSRRSTFASPTTATATRSRASSRRSLGCRRRFAAATRSASRRSVGERIVARQRAAGVARAAAAGAARPPGEGEGRACAARRDRRRRAECSSRRSPTRRRRATANGSSATAPGCTSESGGPRRLLPPARHDVGRLRRIPPLLRDRVRSRRADRRRALQPRRPRLAAAAGEGRPAAHRLRPVALGPAGALPDRIAAPDPWWR